MKKLSVILILIFSVALLSGCIVTPYPHGHVKIKPYKHGPPPHAPAHGYRHHHQHGVELIFDIGVGAYIVVGHPGIYFYNGIYFHRDTKGFWKSAKHYKGPWHMKDVRKVPMKLRNKSLKREYRRDDRERRGEKMERRGEKMERRGEGRNDKRSDRKYDDDDDRRYKEKSRKSDKRGRGHKEKGWKY